VPHSVQRSNWFAGADEGVYELPIDHRRDRGSIELRAFQKIGRFGSSVGLLCRRSIHSYWLTGSACIALLSCEKYLPNQIGVVVLASFGDQLAVEAKVKMVALLIAPAVVCDGVTTGESGHMRTFTDYHFNRHVQALRKESAERGDLFFNEFAPSFERRKFCHRTDDREGEIISYRLLENPRISAIEIFQKLTRPLTLFCYVQKYPPRISPGAWSLNYETPPTLAYGLDLLYLAVIERLKGTPDLGKLFQQKKGGAVIRYFRKFYNQGERLCDCQN
jgi:hypothetical protein